MLAYLETHTHSLLESPIALLLFVTLVVELVCSFRWWAEIVG